MTNMGKTKCPQCGAKMTERQRVCPAKCGYLFYYQHEGMPLSAMWEVLRYGVKRDLPAILAIAGVLAGIAAIAIILS